ncbi:TPA: hypothetical protein PES99_001683 [Staphylococcus aureus]|nr:hypothetical protein [Staphylococcus aureus]
MASIPRAIPPITPQRHIIALHQDASWYQHIKVTWYDTKLPQQHTITPQRRIMARHQASTTTHQSNMS